MLLQAHPVLLHLGVLIIYSHAVFFALGAISATGVFSWLAKKHDLPVEDIYAHAFWIFFIGLLAARVGFFLSYPSAYTSAWQILMIWQGGLVSYWAIFAGLIVAYFIFRSKKNLATWFDLIILSSLLGWGIGRLGNYYAGDSVGVESGVWYIFYGRVPIQLFESILTIFLFIVLYNFLKRWHLRPGTVSFLALIGYFFGRFFIDIWRDEGILLGLHVSQISSLLLLIILFIAFGIWRRKT